MNDIHANLPPVAIPFFTLWDWVVFFVLSLLLTSVIFIWWYFHFRKINTEVIKAQPLQETPPPLPPPTWQIEIKKLENLVKQSKWKQFAHRSTHLLKLYFSETTQTNLLEKTDTELLLTLKKEKHFSTLQNFFAIVTPIKFANIPGNQTKAKTALSHLKTIFKENSAKN